MAFPVLAFAIGSFAASAISGFAGIQANKQAAKAQKQAQKLETALQQEENFREAVKARKLQYRQAAMVAQAGANTGTAEGSGVLGTVGSFATQTASKIGFQGVRSGAAEGMSFFGNKAASAKGKAEAFGAASGLFGQASGFFGNWYANKR